MKQVKCINPKNYRLTLNKEYTVSNRPIRGYYNVINDNNIRVRYSSDLFEDVPQETILEEVARTLNINKQGHNIDVTFNINNIVKTFTFIENSGRLTISCGISCINNINGLASLINNIINDIEVRTYILTKVLNYIIDYKDYAMILISTNVTDNVYYDNIHNSINNVVNNNEMLELQITRNINPNSENEIILYTINKLSEEFLEEDDVNDIANLEDLENLEF